jgi:ADP-L-glycero-D-manno-heptose 6-epimerase
MKVLVTGHKGFIGQNLVKYIQANTNWEVTGWDWGDSVFPTVDGKDWVVHLGAISSTVEQDTDKIKRQNLEFSQRLFEACKRLYVNLQYSSSASIYGLSRDFTESNTGNPLNHYAWSKFWFERWVATQDTSKIVQGFRYFNVYGNHEDHKGTQASPITQFNKQNPIKLFYNSEQYLRDFIAVEDICRVHVEFIQKVPASGIWNIGTGTARSFQEVANVISQRNNTSISYTEMPEILKSSYQKYTCADLTRLEDALGVQRWISIEEWLDKYKL